MCFMCFMVLQVGALLRTTVGREADPVQRHGLHQVLHHQRHGQPFVPVQGRRPHAQHPIQLLRAHPKCPQHQRQAVPQVGLTVRRQADRGGQHTRQLCWRHAPVNQRCFIKSLPFFSRCVFAIGSRHLGCLGAGGEQRLESSIRKCKPPFVFTLLCRPGLGTTRHDDRNGPVN